ncbi:MAG: hypothetical protein [Circular genetic element sp.]|nr:MAG: hypothetical protein [Circular genetic element sp.]
MPKGGKRGKPQKSQKGRVMRKVSKQGAYKKTVKSQMVMRRAPIVETKQRVASDIAAINGHAAGGDDILNPLNWRTIVVDDAFTLIPIDSYYRISHGLEEYQCIGNSLFSKYLNLKLQVRFPDGRAKATLPDPSGTGTYEVPNVMIRNATKLYMICGWVTRNWGLPLVQVNSENKLTSHTATQANLKEYIISQLKPYFDDDEDKLQFRPKATTNIKVDKYVRVKPNLTTAIASQATPANNWSVPGNPNYDEVVIGATGSIPDVYRSWSTKTNRKLTLTEGVKITTPISPETFRDDENLYPNDSWLPFCVLYNPDYETQKARWLPDDVDPLKLKQICAINYRFNDAHYFTDS